ncbi:MAG: alpha-ketoglutarate-dependent dioxygenase AlkB [Bacteroidia bacterium]|nr:alpha-ketoglutarate-dependent dioxygenase AlkB [Bacteroidia bacterium]
MDTLFPEGRQAIELLPGDGEARYFGPLLGEAEARRYFTALMEEIEWRHDEVVLFGRRIVTRRKVAWHGDRPFAYTYSRTTKAALPWTPSLHELKTLAERATGAAYNSCLLNLYHDGSEGMAWHSDGEKTLVPGGSIASFSLGAARRFSFRHRSTKETRSVLLEPGSLLEMRGATQTHWVHSLPPSAKVRDARINLTFRQML